MKRTCFLLGATALSLVGCSGGSGEEAPKANLAPSLSAIAPVELAANSTGTLVAFTLNDESPSSVQITVSSSQPDVIRSTDLVITGRGRERALVLPPVVDITGDVSITLSAEDSGGLTGQSTVDVRVIAQTMSMQAFARSTFDAPDAADPVLINAVEFLADAESDDFADLLAR